MRILLSTITVAALIALATISATPASTAIVCPSFPECTMGIALVCDAGGNCVGTPNTNCDEDPSSCRLLSWSRCGWGRWGIRGGYNTGYGIVKLTVECGGQVLASCQTDEAKKECDSGLGGSGSGGVACLWTVAATYSGMPEPTDHFGACYDPYWPDVVLMAMPEGTDYDLTRHALRFDADLGVWRSAESHLP